MIVVVVCALTGALGACGGGGDASSDAVARVGSQSITIAMLDHWAPVVLGAAYAEKVGGPAPKGLLGEPPGYATCVAALRKLGGGGIQAAIRAEQFKHRCQMLYKAIREQTVLYLVDRDLRVDEAAEVGIKVSGEEFKRFFASMKAELFPTEADLQSYLANKGWTLAEVISSSEQELLSRKLLRFAETSTKYGAVAKKWLALTSCSPGYVVEQCKQYKAPTTPPTTPSAAVQIEEIGALARAAHPPEVNPLGADDQLCKNAPSGKGYSCVAVPKKPSTPASGTRGKR
jgi:hypothetical protein